MQFFLLYKNSTDAAACYFVHAVIPLVNQEVEVLFVEFMFELLPLSQKKIIYLLVQNYQLNEQKIASK